MIRRWRGYLTRRGRFSSVPTATPVVAPTWVPAVLEQAGWHPRAVRFLRHGRFIDPPWPAVPPVVAVVPQQTVRARSRFVATRRQGRFLSVPPTLDFTPTPAVLRQSDMARLSVRPRRGRYAEPPWPAIVQPPVNVPTVLRQADVPRPGSRRRGRFGEPPWPQVVATAPAYPPQTVRAPARRSPVPRRGRVWSPPSDQPVALPPQSRARPRTAAVIRRGQFGDVLPVAPVVPPPYIPAFTRLTRRVAVPTRRGQFTDTFPAPAVAVSEPLPPQWSRADVRPPWRRRGVRAEPPWPAIAPAVAPTIPQNVRPRTRVPGARRGRFWSPPPPQIITTPAVYVPVVASTRRPPVRVIRRGRVTTPPAAPVQPTPPTYQPSFQTRRRWLASPTHRSRFTSVIRPAAAAPASSVPPTRRRPGARSRRGRFFEPPRPYVPPPLFTIGALTAAAYAPSGATTVYAPTGNTATYAPTNTATDTRTGGPT